MNTRTVRLASGLAVLGLAALGLAATTAFAQDPPSREEARSQRLEKVRADLAARIAAPIPDALEPNAFRAALADRYENHRQKQWVEGAVGFFAQRSIRAWLDWSEPGPADDPRPLALRTETEGHPFPVIVDFVRQMHAHDVEVLFAPVPARVDVYPEEFLGIDPVEPFDGYAPHTRRFFQLLVDEGVEVLDLYAVLAAERAYGGDVDPLYLRTDPHWTPRGAEIAARAISQILLSMPGIERGRFDEKYFFVRDSTFSFSAPDKKEMPDAPESELLHFHRVSDADGLPMDARESRAEVVVIGDSFVNEHRGFGGDFSTYLARDLAQKVDAIAVAGGGVKQARNSLRIRLSSGPGRKKVVVWLLSRTSFRTFEDRWETMKMFER